ncbi:MATE family efflux transporter [Marinobacter persicus]|nr:MATE family efflux transporter [Marinobacter persicus]
MLTNLTVPLLGLVDTAVLGHLDSPEYLGAVAVGANLFSILYWTFGFMRMGTTGLAANAVLITFLLVISNALDGFANAAEALIGEAVGRGSRRRFRVVFRTALRWSLWGALALTIGFVLGGRWLISLLTGIEEVRRTAWQYLPWLWLLPFASVWGFLFDGIFIGATRTRDMQNTMLFSALAVFLPVWWLTTGWGNHGLWLSLISLMLARAVSMGWLSWQYSRNGSWFRQE